MTRKAFSIVLLTIATSSLHATNPQVGASRGDLQRAAVGVYKDQSAKSGHDCEHIQGQQPYNICMGEASAQLEQDYRTFYNDLRALLPANVLKPVEDAEKQWLQYREQICRAAYEQFAGGTAAPGAESSCYLQVTRSHMETLYTAFGLALSQ
jgi:uncharacterized protein YecT (DUF1311 family)